MKVLITGGAGFIGANLARTLIDQDRISEVVIIDDLSFGFRSNLDELEVTFVEGSILDEDLLKSTMGGVSAVVHLQGQSDRVLVLILLAHVHGATGRAIAPARCLAFGATRLSST